MLTVKVYDVPVIDDDDAAADARAYERDADDARAYERDAARAQAHAMGNATTWHAIKSDPGMSYLPTMWCGEFCFIFVPPSDADDAGGVVEFLQVDAEGEIVKGCHVSTPLPEWTRREVARELRDIVDNFDLPNPIDALALLDDVLDFPRSGANKGETDEI